MDNIVYVLRHGTTNRFGNAEGIYIGTHVEPLSLCSVRIIDVAAVDKFFHLIIGIALLLVSQAIFNMMVAVGLAPVTGQPLPLISKGGTSTLINCAYIGMILSVSRYTAKLEEQRAHDAQITMQVETGNGNESTYSEAQSAAEPTAKMLNSDAEFE